VLIIHKKLFHMKKSALITILFFISARFATAQPIPPDSLYLGQTPPGNVRILFNLTTDPGYCAVEKIAISPDGKEIYYEETNGNWTSYKFKYYRYSNDHWTGPFDLFTGYYCISMSPDGDRLFFENNSYSDGWASDRQGANWGAPSRIMEGFSVHSLNLTTAGHYYLSSFPVGCLGQRDICKLIIESTDTTLTGLGLPVNSGANEGDFFISNDETFMIFMSNRPGGYGSTDLYISYRKNNDSWTNPKNLGPSVNTATDDFGPYITSDGKYLFYESGYSAPGSIYWIRADQLIDSLRYTNFVPYVKHPIPDQTAVTGQFFSFAIPDTTFVDDDGNNTLTFTARLTDGNHLPAWLTFDSITATFSGIPELIQSLNLRVQATDTAGASASTMFKINVEEPSSSDPLEGADIRIFPNPTRGQATISLGSVTAKPAFLEVKTPEGKNILKNTFRKETEINLSNCPKGIYIVKITVEHQKIIRKICVE
jgi:hypothetical protein